MPRTRRPKNPADRIYRIRLREAVHFPDLSERRALKLTALPRYASRAHFGLWLRRFGSFDFNDPDRVYTPLVHVDLESMDLVLDPLESIQVRGRTQLARILDAAGEIRNLARDGEYTLERSDGETLARIRMVNFFTRYDPVPERRRVTRLPAAMGLGDGPSREIAVPTVEDFLAVGRPPDLEAGPERTWHYGQTDPNRHVNGVEYIRILEEYVSTELARRGHDLARLFLRRVRIVYRKPCFRGETYRCVGWLEGSPPSRVGACIHKGDDGPHARPAVAVEFEIGRHEETR